MQCWREVFAASLHEARGKWRLGEFSWHVFSFGFARALSGEKAVHEYTAQPLSPFFLLPEENTGLPAYFCMSDRWPDLRQLELDVYVSPEGLAWTMAFTHEASSGLGPYFSRAEWLKMG